VVWALPCSTTFVGKDDELFELFLKNNFCRVVRATWSIAAAYFRQKEAFQGHPFYLVGVTGKPLSWMEGDYSGSGTRILKA
ncbi:MAG: hypothetical protein AAF514_19250, partial [Verrucomicrobiota bacterium]